MKRILIFKLLFVVVMFTACQTDDLIDQPELDNTEVESDVEWEFTKDVTLTNGENTAFIRVCSNYEDSLNLYLENMAIELNVFTKEQKLVENVVTTKNSNQNVSESSQFNCCEPSVVIVHLGGNFLPEVTSSYISFKPKLLKSVYGPLPIAAHESYTKFIGMITEDDGGLDLMVTFKHKSKWYSSWTQIATNSITARPDNNYYHWDFDTYKNRMTVYRDTEDTVYPSYGVYTVVSDFQEEGTNCLMGSYNGCDCLVGIPPSGTTAFIYNDKFYYTPVNGNECSLAGSSYDGANCFVADIVDYANASIWNNKMYVDSYITSDLFGKVE